MSQTFYPAMSYNFASPYPQYTYFIPQYVPAPSFMGQGQPVVAQQQQVAPVHRKRTDTLRPFAYACRRAYDLIRKLAFGSLPHFYDDMDHIVVRGLDPKAMIEFVSTDGRQQKWALHTLLYGKMTTPDFTVREDTHSKYGIISPFKALQCLLLSQDLFLTNESDPEKGHALIFVIRRVPPSDSVVPLWHQQNVMPSGPDDKLIFDRFYQASFSDAAIFVNRRVFEMRESQIIDDYIEPDKDDFKDYTP